MTTAKRSPDITLVVNLFSPDGRYDQVYVSNFAFLQVKDALARMPGVGSIIIFGARDYCMRIWLDPQKIAARNLTADDVVNAIREQNVQVAAGQIGQPPIGQGVSFQYIVNTQGRLTDEKQFGGHRHQERAERPGDAPAGRGAGRIGGAGLQHEQQDRRPADRGGGHLPVARLQLDRNLRRGPRGDEKAQGTVSAGAGLPNCV